MGRRAVPRTLPVEESEYGMEAVGGETHTNWVTDLAQEALLGLLLLILRLVGGGDVVAALGLLVCFVAGHAGYLSE